MKGRTFVNQIDFAMVYQVEVLNPEAHALLESLVRLRLIRLHQHNPSGAGFWDLLEDLRSQGAESDLTEEDILQEVETARTLRYERAPQSHH
ncbi:MAG: hypothetical protein H7246_09045 [Phycisphaerae bacterium]|nr:hypothetical protein [Saprospiraceae bacterium]